jgi:hypothetical protein
MRRIAAIHDISHDGDTAGPSYPRELEQSAFEGRRAGAELPARAADIADPVRGRFVRPSLTNL